MRKSQMENPRRPQNNHHNTWLQRGFTKYCYLDEWNSHTRKGYLVRKGRPARKLAVGAKHCRCSQEYNFTTASYDVKLNL